MSQHLNPRWAHGPWTISFYNFDAAEVSAKGGSTVYTNLIMFVVPLIREVAAEIGASDSVPRSMCLW
jgi:hypothetical protein